MDNQQASKERNSKELREFLDSFRDFARLAIAEIVNSSGMQQRWWGDIEAYNRENAGKGNIIDTVGRTPDFNHLDHNGTAKWLMRMYPTAGRSLNSLLYGTCSVRLLCQDDVAYRQALATFLNLRNTYYGHDGAEELTDAQLFDAIHVIIWLIKGLSCAAQPTALHQTRGMRNALATQYRNEGKEVINFAQMAEFDTYTLEDAGAAACIARMDALFKERQAARQASGSGNFTRSPHAFSFEEWPITEPILFAPWEAIYSPELEWPSKLGQQPFRRKYKQLRTATPSEGSANMIEEKEELPYHLAYAQGKKNKNTTLENPKKLQEFERMFSFIFPLCIAITGMIALIPALISKTNTKDNTPQSTVTDCQESATKVTSKAFARALYYDYYESPEKSSFQFCFTLWFATAIIAMIAHWTMDSSAAAFIILGSACSTIPQYLFFWHIYQQAKKQDNTHYNTRRAGSIPFLMDAYTQLGNTGKQFVKTMTSIMMFLATFAGAAIMLPAALAVWICAAQFYFSKS